MRLSEAEHQLVEAVAAGRQLDFADAPDRTVRADVLRDLLLGKLVDALDPRGVRLSGAVVTGSLDLADVRSESPLVLVACEVPEPLVLRRARLAGLTLDGCTVEHIDADELHSAGPVLLDGIRCAGGISLAYADVGGALSLQRAWLETGPRVAVKADGITVAGNVVLTNGFHADSACQEGTVRFPAARIGGQLRLTGAVLRNDGGGPALLADSAQVAVSIILTGLRATADSGAAVRLVRTQTKSMLYLDDATIENPDGVALNATAVQVGADLRLGPGLRTSGAAAFPGAHVKGQLRVADVRLAGGTPRLDLTEVTVDGPISLPVGELVNADPAFRIAVDGLTYRRVPFAASVDEWLALLRRHTPGYTAQPYQQLAAVHRAAGHERDTKRILIAQQRDLGERGQLGGFAARLRHRASGFLLGHGYRPTRPLAGLLATLLLACVLVLGADNDTAVRAADGVKACTVTEHLAMAANLSIPVVRLASQRQCEFVPTTPAGQWYVVAGWIVTLLGWGFATLFVAGYTGLVRKT
ncbi:hypothetical protein Amsp01_106140 [Amycolatopsis sp. NBRC 101858]|uniref:hypothetical protein n=1 Tax=Amycolatopsis sp. NBRC 101858 TaxID=3032200 RepID=UPI0024A4CFDD|nr:hypothetical protein [Amycolatopsis sp. NBRC 101858]GLY44591.1 hypothetical protein Amsp01_106140 [Amycolatopsis sp. NBRC 101858]